MKLNQHGWSMKEMILLSSILFAFLLLLVFMVTQIQSGLSKKENILVEEYESVEWIVFTSAIDYYGENFDGDENVRITTSKLVKEGYLESEDLKVNQDTCSGYVKFSDEEPSVYIRCENYKTKGYKE